LELVENLVCTERIKVGQNLEILIPAILAAIVVGGEVKSYAIQQESHALATYLTLHASCGGTHTGVVSLTWEKVNMRFTSINVPKLLTLQL